MGEVVYFLDAIKNNNVKQEYSQWFVKFRSKEGGVYSVSQLYFVCEDVWQDVVKYIAVISLYTFQ